MTRRAWMTIVKLAVIAAAGVAIAVALSRMGRPREKGLAQLGPSFAYDIGERAAVPDELVVAEEIARLVPDLADLRAVAVDASGRVVVAGGREVRTIVPGTTNRVSFKLAAEPRALAVRDGRLYVGFERHVEVFDAAGGDSLAVWPDLGERALVTSVAAAEDDVFVADAGQRLVWQFDREGALKRRLGAEDGTDGGDFVIPSPSFDVAVGPDDTPWIVNPGRQRIVNYGLDGRRRSAWGRAGLGVDGFAGCCNPTHLAVRSDGSFVTSEKGAVRVKLYSAKGALLGVVAGPDAFGPGARGLDLAVDPRGRVVILDGEAGAVRIFEITGQAEAVR